MSYKDFQKFFDRLEICNLSPDSLTEEDVELGKKKWEMSVFEGDWVRGVTAGGCRNYLGMNMILVTLLNKNYIILFICRNIFS